MYLGKREREREREREHIRKKILIFVKRWTHRYDIYIIFSI
ncbi:MAG: hypothetical protein N7Q72_01990 [Spiroplasma sp. Tabriz.8]|nr:hypothetical protein [Spiroplasma sp. Tabriz.8]